MPHAQSLWVARSLKPLKWTATIRRTRTLLIMHELTLHPKGEMQTEIDVNICGASTFITQYPNLFDTHDLALLIGPRQ
jgi:hypothetical protein